MQARIYIMVAIGTGFSIALMIIAFWFLHRSPTDIIPIDFRGVWHDLGAECGDSDAQASITGSSVNYDVLVFQADRILENRNRVVIVSGISFPNGRADYENVTLRLSRHATQLYIDAADLHNKGPLVRCDR